MPDAAAAPAGGARPSLSVRYRGSVRGVPVRGAGTLVLFPDRAELRMDGGADHVKDAPGGSAGRDALGALPAWRLDYDAVRTLERAGGTLALRVERVGELWLDADDEPALAALAAQLLTRCCTLPELTSALPTLGSRRATLDAPEEHQRFFAPLLEARRAAARAGDAASMVRALDAGALAARLDETLRAFAGARHPDRASARRALEAQLEACVEPLQAALAAQEETTRAFRDMAGEGRLALWRAWTERVRLTFLRADECWRQVRAVLLAHPIPPRRGWLP